MCGRHTDNCSTKKKNAKKLYMKRNSKRKKMKLEVDVAPFFLNNSNSFLKSENSLWKVRKASNINSETEKKTNILESRNIFTFFLKLFLLLLLFIFFFWLIGVCLLLKTFYWKKFLLDGGLRLKIFNQISYIKT